MRGAKMTWQGGKRAREVGPSFPFARLTPLAGEGDDPARALEMLGHALSDYPSPLRLEVRLVSEGDDNSVEHWEVPAGSRSPSVRRKQSKDADVVVVMRPETWMQIARGHLA